jgi:hypothetical protein
MHQIGPLAVWMLDEFGGAGEQPRDAEAKHDAHHHADVQEYFGCRRIGFHGGLPGLREADHPKMGTADQPVENRHPNRFFNCLERSGGAWSVK